MKMSTHAAPRELKPRSLGILVAIVGVLACVAPALFFIPVFGALPVVAAWAWVYGYAGHASDRWPWWVMGQWVSLCGVFVVTLLILGLGLPTLWVAPWIATVMTAVWMVPVGLVTAHRHSWATKRPEETVVGSSDSPDIAPTESSLQI